MGIVGVHLIDFRYKEDLMIPLDTHLFLTVLRRCIKMRGEYISPFYMYPEGSRTICATHEVKNFYHCPIGHCPITKELFLL